MQAARLLVRRPVVRGGPERVERARRGGEEAVGVEVRAGDPVRLDDLVGRRPRRAAAGRKINAVLNAINPALAIDIIGSGKPDR